MSVNKAIIVGYAGKDTEVRYMPNGEPVANLSVATSERWKDKSTGEPKEATEWHRLVIFGKLAEVAGDWVKSGTLAYYEGKLKTRKWTDKDGIDRYTTEIHVREMKMLGSKDDSAQRQQERKPEPRQEQPEQAHSGGGVASLDDDIPFNQAPYGYCF